MKLAIAGLVLMLLPVAGAIVLEDPEEAGTVPVTTLIDYDDVDVGDPVFTGSPMTGGGCDLGSTGMGFKTSITASDIEAARAASGVKSIQKTLALSPDGDCAYSVVAKDLKVNADDVALAFAQESLLSKGGLFDSALPSVASVEEVESCDSVAGSVRVKSAADDQDWWLTFQRSTLDFCSDTLQARGKGYGAECDGNSRHTFVERYCKVIAANYGPGDDTHGSSKGGYKWAVGAFKHWLYTYEAGFKDGAAECDYASGGKVPTNNIFYNCVWLD